MGARGQCAKTRECVPVAATDPLYILYTSGTTGMPKGVVRDNGGHMVALEWSMQNLYGVNPGEVWWSGSDVGWVVGHSYIVYAPLFHGCTSILYEGKPVGTPDAGAFWRVIAEHGVVALFTAPTAFRAIRKEDPDAKLLKQYDLSKFRTLFLAGERADPPTIQWAEEHLKVPVHRSLVADRNRLVHRRQSARPRRAAGEIRLGLRADAGLRHRHRRRGLPSGAGQQDRLASWSSCRCRRPISRRCGSRTTASSESYLDEFPGYYKTADAGYKDDDGYIFVMSRTDDIINVAGHRLSTGGMEEVLAVAPGRRGMRRARHQGRAQGRGALRLHRAQGRRRPPADEIEKEIVALVREKIGPVAAFKLAITVARLPKTRSGKILRGTIKKIADGDNWTMPATIDDPAILDEIAGALKGHGMGG